MKKPIKSILLQLFLLLIHIPVFIITMKTYTTFVTMNLPYEGVSILIWTAIVVSSALTYPILMFLMCSYNIGKDLRRLK